MGRAVLSSKRNSPHIFFAAGVAGAVGATVLACRATLKLEKTVDEIRNDIHDVKTHAELERSNHTLNPTEVMPYTDNMYYKDMGNVYVKSGLRVMKLYGPPTILGVASIAALTGSHVQLTRRNSALTATLAAVTKFYDEYRERVRKVVGDEKEREIYHDVKDVEVEGKGGKKAILKAIDLNGFSLYSKIFDEYNVNWSNSSEINRNFLQCQQNYANDKLKANGYLFLNDVYESLGFPKTEFGQVVGWVLDCSDDPEGDNYVDFGLFQSSLFINGQEQSIVLDFNVDGPVLDRAWRKKT